MVHVGVMVAVLTLVAGAAAQERVTLKDEKQVISYALGMNLASQFKAQALEIDEESLNRGLRDALSGGRTLLSDREMQTLLAGLRERLKRSPRAATAGPYREAADANRRAGEAFLAANKARDGVITLESGVQYKVVRAGGGRVPTMSDRVVIHYRGTFVDGTEFDSSYRAGRPATFALSRMVTGWREALQRMPVGSKWQIVIPSRLAYGEQGAGATIGPNATLIFDVELLSIVERTDRTTPDTTTPDTATPDATAPDATAPEATAPEATSDEESSDHHENRAGDAPHSDQNPAPSSTATGLSRLVVSFKMDSRLATGTYGAKDRWVSPAVFSKAGEGPTCTIDVRARGVDAGRKAVSIAPTWTPSDPEMVTVSAGADGAAQLIVRRPGETSIRVSSDGVSRDLAVKAILQHDVLQVSISQK